jgi:hypothetical protein
VWIVAGVLALVLAALFLRVLLPPQAGPNRPGWVSDGWSFPKRRTSDSGPDRGTPFDLHNWRDLIIIVVAVVVFVVAAVWLLGIRGAAG